MARFHLITETDARRLDRGSTVRLAAGGHVTPLALDTLRERRITVVRDDGVDADPDRLAPARVRVVAVVAEPGCRATVEAVLARLRGLGLEARDLDTGRAVTYPEAAAAVARLVADAEVQAGIVVDRSGFGPAIAANKVLGVRAAACATVADARRAREDAGATVLALGMEALSPPEAAAVAEAFVTTPMRDPNRLQLLRALDRVDRSRGRG